MALLVAFGSCADRHSSETDTDNIFSEAKFIRGGLRPDGAMEISVVNPWDTTALLSRYILVGDDSIANAIKDDTGGATLLRLPMRRLVVYSAVHAALLAELGYADAIVGVADARYIKTPAITERLADGRIADVGSSVEPSMEKILSLHPDAIILSPFQNSGHGAVDKAGIPVIEGADYMESTPLGRAEWSRFYAMLVQGVSEANDTLYNGVKQRYDSLVAGVDRTVGSKPVVITELPQQGTWMMPGGESYAARLLMDAGAEYPFASEATPGSLTMNYETVYLKAGDADFWFTRQLEDVTLEDIRRNHRYNERFKAFRDGGIYNANTTRCNIFEETPFRPDLLLSDYVAIFRHRPDSVRYFTRVKE